LLKSKARVSVLKNSNVDLKRTQVSLSNK